MPEHASDVNNFTSHAAPAGLSRSDRVVLAERSGSWGRAARHAGQPPVAGWSGFLRSCVCGRRAMGRRKGRCIPRAWHAGSSPAAHHAISGGLRLVCGRADGVAVEERRQRLGNSRDERLGHHTADGAAQTRRRVELGPAVMAGTAGEARVHAHGGVAGADRRAACKGVACASACGDGLPDWCYHSTTRPFALGRSPGREPGPPFLGRRAAPMVKRGAGPLPRPPGRRSG